MLDLTAAIEDIVRAGVGKELPPKAAERPTPEQYRKMAAALGTTFHDAWTKPYCFALRCAAEDAEGAQETRKVLYLILTDYRNEMQSWEGDGRAYAESLVAQADAILGGTDDRR
jgi:hypothetical protein